MRTASEATSEFYQRGGELLLMAAARHSGIDPTSAAPNDLVHLLCQHVTRDKSILASGTVCVYRQQIASIMDRLVDAGADTYMAAAARKDLVACLLSRQGTPSPLRGASLKVEVPEKTELADVFDLLKHRFLNDCDVQDLVLCLYILIIPRLGLRPIEVTWARREGRSLFVATAKRDGRPERRIPLKGWPENLLFALDVFLSLVPRELDAVGFKRWRNALASKLARASLHSRKHRRLALYCCRHIAFANWREIGMSPEDIRILAGHAMLSSQNAYARGKKGFGPKWMFSEANNAVDIDTTSFLPASYAVTPSRREDRSQVVDKESLSDAVESIDAICTGTLKTGQSLAERTSASCVELSPAPAPGASCSFVVEDLPMAVPKTALGPPSLSHADVRSHFDRLFDPRPVEQIVAKLRQAPIDSDSAPAPAPAGPDEHPD